MLTTSDIIGILGLCLMLMTFYTYEIYTTSYSKGFRDGLEVGKKIGYSDSLDTNKREI